MIIDSLSPIHYFRIITDPFINIGLTKLDENPFTSYFISRIPIRIRIFYGDHVTLLANWFCFIGGFDDLRKGQDFFLKATKLLSEKYSDMEFVLVGGGKRLQSYQEQYETDRIRFLGRMDNPITVLKGSDLLVVPSLADSCPNTVMEALYTNVPVIGSRTGGIPEILQDEGALFAVEPNALAERIEKLFLDRTEYALLKERQRLRAQELSFDWAEKIMDCILS